MAQERPLDGRYLVAGAAAREGPELWLGSLAPNLDQVARALRKMARASWISADVTSSGGIQRMTLWYLPQVSSSNPWSAQRAMSASPMAPSGSRVSRSLHELHADHQPRSANVTDARVLRGDRLESRGQLRAASRRVLHQPLVADGPQHGDTRRTGDRVATERGAVRTGAPAAHQVATGDHRRERQAIGDALGQGDHIGHDPGVLEAPHPARPPEARLDLVADDQDAVLVGDLP